MLVNWLRESALRWLVSLRLLPRAGTRPTQLQWYVLTLAVVLAGGIQGGAVMNLTLTVSDNMAAVGWVDAIATQLALPPNVPLTLSDNLNSPGWADSLMLGYGLDIRDDANSWADAATLVLGTPTLNLTLSVADDLNAPWADAITFQLGYNLALSDDGGANWADSLALQLAYLLALSDDGSANWNDSFASFLAANLTLTVSDTGAVNWNDTIETQLNIVVSGGGGASITIGFPGMRVG